jgi:3-deoxy-D-manno-octulosonic-acid transferase/heptosyltransferase-1
MATNPRFNGNPTEILIVKLSALGDVIHTLPALCALRRAYPDARITWLVEAAAAGLVEGHPAVDRVIVSRRKAVLRRVFRAGAPVADRRCAVRDLTSFLRTLRDTPYDIVLDFQSLLKSGILIGAVRGRRGVRKIGFDRGMAHAEESHIFLTERIPPVSMEIHALVRNLMMLAPLGIADRRVEYRLPISPADRTCVRERLAAAGIRDTRRLVVVNPVAKWATKLWPGGRFSALGDRLIQECGADLVFTGGPEDRVVTEDICRRMRRPAVNLAGETTLMQLAALYETSRVLVSTDTGPMHLGAAAGVPVVALFGPTAPWRTGPYGPLHRVIRKPLPCAPCFKRTCNTVACMAAIDVEDVFTEAARWLAP